jgi:hypothetical protein
VPASVGEKAGEVFRMLRTNGQTLRDRFKIKEENYSIASRIMRDTLEAGLIKLENSENKSKKYTAVTIQPPLNSRRECMFSVPGMPLLSQVRRYSLSVLQEP